MSLVQRAGSWEAAPHGAFPSDILRERAKSLFQPQLGQHTLKTEQTHPQSRNFIPPFKRKLIAVKTTYARLPLHNCSLQSASNKNKGYQCNVSTSVSPDIACSSAKGLRDLENNHCRLTADESCNSSLQIQILEFVSNGRLDG